MFKYRGRYWSFLLKMHPDLPAPTIPAQRVTFNGPFHWSSRHLRIRELARLQGFPDWYTWSADRHHARVHIGNAVPPLLGGIVVWRVLGALGVADQAVLPAALAKVQEASSTFEDVSQAMRGAGVGAVRVGRSGSRRAPAD
jgi:hypothetical protein